MGGGGVDGAILRAGGTVQLQARRELVERIGSLPTGQAASTDAGTMPARWIIHVVGPVHSRSEDRRDLLASCYREALRVADELGARTIAFPAVSAGIYGWPIDSAADIAVADRCIDNHQRRARALRAVQRGGAGAVPTGARRTLAVTAVPEEIELPDVGARLRRHRPEDVDALLAAVEESRDHLRPHMPWADEGRAELAAFIAEAVEQWATGRDRNFVIEDVASGELLGGCGLHARVGVDGARDRLLAAGRRHRSGLVTAAARALTDLALAVDGVSRVEIHCDEANVRSAAVARRLGYRLDRIEPDAVSAPGDLGRSMIWVWAPADLIGHGAARSVAGRRWWRNSTRSSRRNWPIHSAPNVAMLAARAMTVRSSGEASIDDAHAGGAGDRRASTGPGSAASRPRTGPARG